MYKAKLVSLSYRRKSKPWRLRTVVVQSYLPNQTSNQTPDLLMTQSILPVNNILTADLRCSSCVQTDNTGARYQGQNGVYIILCNESFVWYATTSSKSRKNFPGLLHRLFRTYELTADTLDYLGTLEYPRKWLCVLQQYVGMTFPWS